MKLKPLDKTKRYDLSELNDEELLCVLNWLKENDKGWGGTTLGNITECKNILLYFFIETWVWEHDFTKKSIKPIFIQENKQDQFLTELQELCKKYDSYIQVKEDYMHIYTNNGRGSDIEKLKHINSEDLI